MRKSYWLVLVLVLFICFTPIAGAAQPVNTNKEISTFYNGKLQISPYKSVIVNDAATYVPLRLIESFDHINVQYDGPSIRVVTDKGTFSIDKQNTILHQNTTYITFKKLQQMSAITGKYISSATSLFLWDTAVGAAKTDELVSHISTVPGSLREDFGKKIFPTSEFSSRWIIDVTKSAVDPDDYNIEVMKPDGTTETIPYQYVSETGLRALKNMMLNQTIWINKNSTSATFSSNLKHIEKVTITSIKFMDSSLFYTLRKQNGTQATISHPLFDVDSMSNRYPLYNKNPKSVFNWKQSVWKNIENETVAVGMEMTQVLMAWGEPDRTYPSKSPIVEANMWIYGNTYLYFTDFKLSLIQD
ncbi:hypothetical protein MH117_21325 [Paenibacillus sp. ACRRX]|uniref:hypothetical protein n=1 Tax=Paenibacillus sp. ACRRX TaxID=2918206 RepID=UPI001EF49C5A|nr:hypothetical protein [Paenibacillus sp. ACRRX]MCG7409955.1 hypothetical protein [Paenibacillus sp. ACRRX]